VFCIVWGRSSIRGGWRETSKLGRGKKKSGEFGGGDDKPKSLYRRTDLESGVLQAWDSEKTGGELNTPTGESGGPDSRRELRSAEGVEKKSDCFKRENTKNKKKRRKRKKKKFLILDNERKRKGSKGVRGKNPKKHRGKERGVCEERPW